MSKTKNFTVRMARMVYEFKYSDNEIIGALMHHGLTGEDAQEEREWLQEQIDTVRANPKHFKQFVGRPHE